MNEHNKLTKIIIFKKIFKMPAKRHIMDQKFFICGVLPFQLWGNSEGLSESASTIFDREKNLADGNDRLYRMFSMDASGSFSHELTTVFQAAVFGAVVGGAYGGYKTSIPSPEEMERNKAIALTMKFDERRSTAEASGKKFIHNFFKGAFQLGWRIGLFCGSLTMITTVTSTYRGRSGVLEYILAGGVLGTFTGWKGGGKAMGVRGLMGTALGTLCGCAAYVLTTLSGTTTEETCFWKYGWEEAQLKPSKERVVIWKEESRQYIEREMGENTLQASTLNESSNT